MHSYNGTNLFLSMESWCISHHFPGTASRGMGIRYSRPQLARQRQDWRPYVGSRCQRHAPFHPPLGIRPNSTLSTKTWKMLNLILYQHIDVCGRLLKLFSIWRQCDLFLSEFVKHKYSQETDEDRIMTFRPRYFHSRQNRISYDNELCNDFYPISQHIVLFYPVSTLLL